MRTKRVGLEFDVAPAPTEESARQVPLGSCSCSSVPRSFHPKSSLHCTSAGLESGQPKSLVQAEEVALKGLMEKYVRKLLVVSPLKYLSSLTSVLERDGLKSFLTWGSQWPDALVLSFCYRTFVNILA